MHTKVCLAIVAVAAIVLLGMGAPVATAEETCDPITRLVCVPDEVCSGHDRYIEIGYEIQGTQIDGVVYAKDVEYRNFGAFTPVGLSNGHYYYWMSGYSEDADCIN